MFGLSEQISGHPVGFGGVIGDDHRFSWVGQAVYPHHAEDLALGEGDEQVAGAEDFIHRWDRFRAIGQRSDGLRAAQGIHFAHAAQGAGGQDDGGNRLVIGNW